ncbi:unnamed protein product [Cylicocyclus nassatus]|uniref:Uncharacterized protein n=1 Tax=Cylicocyclus nassatus TaxID=53992 RepID=A0AA36GRD8_CYLNA|nr:unnamed protein product [Cylicocyclus nassatus]
MNSLGLLLFFLTLRTVDALRCYNEETDGKTHPKHKMDCTPYGSEYCVKAQAYGGGGIYEAIYTCAQGFQCTSNGCISPRRNVVKCCCDKDLCNSSSLSSFLSIVTLIIATYISL